MKQEKIFEIEAELSELKTRARRVTYKNIIPKLPTELKFKQEGLQNSLLVGFYKRLTNWKKGLVIMENPGGLMQAERQAKKEETFIASTATLAEHFNARQ